MLLSVFSFWIILSFCFFDDIKIPIFMTFLLICILRWYLSSQFTSLSRSPSQRSSDNSSFIFLRVIFFWTYSPKSLALTSPWVSVTQFQVPPRWLLIQYLKPKPTAWFPHSHPAAVFSHIPSLSEGRHHLCRSSIVSRNKLNDVCKHGTQWL